MTSIDPGLVETEFSQVRYHGDEERAETRRYEPVRRLSPRDVRALAVLNMVVMTSQDWANCRRMR